MRLSIVKLVIGLVAVLLSLQLLMGIYVEVKVNAIGAEIKAVADHDMVITKSMTNIVEHQLEQEILYEKAIKQALEARG